ncbi:MAG TPA: helix-turn-helix domain-containing protein [Ohtaekwangia sp.]|nr:helix-turn-helix domain-containing protein [Ohtaekwangia sp.]
MEFAAYTPCPELQPYIKVIWELRSSRTAQQCAHFEKVLPDGCAELILQLGEPFLQRNGQRVIKQGSAFVYGQITRYIELQPQAYAHTVGVKFHPYGLSCFTRLPQDALLNASADMRDLFPAGDDYLTEKLFHARHVQERVRLIEQHFISLLRQIRFLQQPDLLREAVERINRLNGQARIADLARSLYTTRRELERKFKSGIGISPKQLSGICKFKQVMTTWKNFNSLTELALAAGYYDQSHFIKDFKSFAGEKPKIFLARTSELTDVFTAGV